MGLGLGVDLPGPWIWWICECGSMSIDVWSLGRWQKNLLVATDGIHSCMDSSYQPWCLAEGILLSGVDISPRSGRLIEVSEGKMINNFCIGFGFMPSAGIHSSIDWMSCLLPLPELPWFHQFLSGPRWCRKRGEGVPLVNNAYRAPQSLKASYAEKSSECWLWHRSLVSMWRQ